MLIHAILITSVKHEFWKIWFGADIVYFSQYLNRQCLQFEMQIKIKLCLITKIIYQKKIILSSILHNLMSAFMGAVQVYLTENAQQVYKTLAITIVISSSPLSLFPLNSKTSEIIASIMASDDISDANFDIISFRCPESEYS